MSDTYFATVAELRLAVADFLDGLTADEWDAPSLCAGWRVRDVAGHLSCLPTLRLGEMVAAAPRAGFDANRINTAVAVRYGSLDPPVIVARIREHAGCRTTARGLSTDNWLFDLVVHSQDMAVPLNRGFEVPAATCVAGLDRVWSMGWPFRARRRLGHLRLAATDGEWTVGQGPEVRGPALHLLLLLTGRIATAVPHLAGPGIGSLR